MSQGCPKSTMSQPQLGCHVLVVQGLGAELLELATRPLGRVSAIDAREPSQVCPPRGRHPRPRDPGSSCLCALPRRFSPAPAIDAEACLAFIPEVVDFFHGSLMLVCTITLCRVKQSFLVGVTFKFKLTDPLYRLQAKPSVCRNCPFVPKCLVSPRVNINCVHHEQSKELRLAE